MEEGDLARAGHVFWLFPAQLSGFGVINGILYYAISPRIRRRGRFFRVESAIFTGIGAAVHLLVSGIVFVVETGGPLFVTSPSPGQVTLSQFMDLNSLSLGIPSIIATLVGSWIDRAILNKRETRERERTRQEIARQKIRS